MKRFLVTAIAGALAILSCGVSRLTAAENEFVKIGSGGRGLVISSKATGVQAELFVTGADAASSTVLDAAKVKLRRRAPSLRWRRPAVRSSCASRRDLR